MFINVKSKLIVTDQILFSYDKSILFESERRFVDQHVACQEGQVDYIKEDNAEVKPKRHPPLLGQE